VPAGVPFLSVKDIKATGISFNGCRYITQEQHQEFCRRCAPAKGDVLYTKVGTTGVAKAIDTDREFSIFVSVALLKLGPNVSPDYLEKALNSGVCRAQAANLTQGMANRNLVLQDLKRIEVPIPPPSNQRWITVILNKQMSEVDRLRESLDAQLEGINKLPAALLRRAFRGELG
jgi:type I restriction enzyme, S subunit